MTRMDEPDKPKRTAAATAARMRQREEKAASLLVERGWKVFTPNRVDWQTILEQEGKLPPL